MHVRPSTHPRPPALLPLSRFWKYRICCYNIRWNHLMLTQFYMTGKLNPLCVLAWCQRAKRVDMWRHGHENELHIRDFSCSHHACNELLTSIFHLDMSWAVNSSALVLNIMISDKFWIISHQPGLDSFCKSIFNIPHQQDSLALRTSRRDSSEYEGRLATEEPTKYEEKTNHDLFRNAGHFQPACAHVYIRVLLHDRSLTFPRPVKWFSGQTLLKNILSNAKLLVTPPPALC